MINIPNRKIAIKNLETRIKMQSVLFDMLYTNIKSLGYLKDNCQGEVKTEIKQLLDKLLKDAEKAKDNDEEIWKSFTEILRM